MRELFTIRFYGDKNFDWWPLLKLTLNIVFLFFSNVLYAQENKVEGTVTDRAGRPVADALVSIVGSRHDYTVGQALTDSLGQFVIIIGDIETEATILTVGHMSYELYAQPFSIPSGPLRISLRETVFKMDEVVVEGKPNPISFDKGELIVDVSKVKNYERLNTDQLLNRLPGISVSDNAVSLYGKPVTVYINGIKQMMGTEAVLKYLSALPAKALSTIKVIPLPTGKYGSDVSAVIDIHMDKDMPEGYFSQSEMKGGLTDKDLGNYGGSQFFMMKKGKVTFNTLLSYDNRDIWSKDRDSLYFAGADKYVLGANKVNGRRGAIRSTSNLTFDLGKGNLLDFNVFIYYDQSKKTREWISRKGTPHENDIRQEDFRADISGNDDMYSGAVRYSSDEGKKNYLTAYYYGMYGSVKSKGKYYRLDTDGFDGFQKDNATMKGHMHTFAVDAVSKLSEKSSLEYGVQADLNFLTDNVSYFGFKTDALKSSSVFKANEFILAGYARFIYNIGENHGFSLDLRNEYAKYTYDEKTSDQGDDLNDNKLIPRIHYWLSIPNYRVHTRIWTFMERPNYTYLLPGNRYVNDYYYEKGNPELKNEVTYQLSIIQTFWGFLVLDARYSMRFNYIYGYYGSDNNAVFKTYANVGDINSVSATLIAPFELFGNTLFGEFSGIFAYNMLRDANPELGLGKNKANWAVGKISLKVFYDITDRLSVNSEYQYIFPENPFQEKEEQVGLLSAGISYAFMKKRNLIVELKGVNLIPSHYNHCRSYIFNNNVYEIHNNSPRLFSFSLKYTFNKGEKVEHRDNSGNFDRMIPK